MIYTANNSELYHKWLKIHDVIAQNKCCQGPADYIQDSLPLTCHYTDEISHKPNLLMKLSKVNRNYYAFVTNYFSHNFASFHSLQLHLLLYCLWIINSRVPIWNKTECFVTLNNCFIMNIINFARLPYHFVWCLLITISRDSSSASF